MMIELRQQKTGTLVAVPAHRDLAPPFTRPPPGAVWRHAAGAVADRPALPAPQLLAQVDKAMRRMALQQARALFRQGWPRAAPPAARSLDTRSISASSHPDTYLPRRTEVAIAATPPGKQGRMHTGRHPPRAPAKRKGTNWGPRAFDHRSPNTKSCYLNSMSASRRGEISILMLVSRCFGVHVRRVLRCPADWVAQGRTRRRKTTVDRFLMRGLVTAGPVFVLGLSLSQSRGLVPRIRSRVALTCRRAHLCATGFSLSSFPGCRFVCWVATDLCCPDDGLCHTGDGPDECRHLSGDRDHDDVLRFAGPLQATVAGAQADLRLPGGGPDRLRQPLVAPSDVLAHAGREPVGPRSFNQHPARPGVAGLGDVAAGDLRPEECSWAPGRAKPSTAAAR